MARRFGLWQPGSHRGFGILTEAGAPSWFELHTRDDEGALAFYRKVFRWDTQMSDTPEFRYTTLKKGEDMLAGVMDAASFLPEGVPTSGYAGGVLPGMLVLAVFSGITLPTIGNASLHEVTGQDASLASGVQSAVQQLGGAIGLSCLVAFALRHAADQAHQGASVALASTSGYALAFRIGAVLLVVGGVLVTLLLEQVQSTPAQPIALEAEPVPVGAAAYRRW